MKRYNMKSVARFFLCGLVALLVLIFIKSWYLDVYKTVEIIDQPMIPQAVHRKVGLVESKITLILRYTPNLSAYLLETVYSFLSVFPQLSIIIVCDTTLKRSALSNLTYLEGQVDVVSLKLDLLNPNVKPCFGHYVKTEFVLVVPIGVAARPAETILNLIKLLKSSNASIVSVPVSDREPAECLNLDLNFLQWTIEYKMNHFHSLCDAIKGDHAMLMYSKTLQKLTVPFMLPFPESFYIQSTALKMTVKLLDNVSFKKFKNFALDSSHERKIQMQRVLMNQEFKIKKVVRESGLVEWYGCTRETFRCFGDIVDSVPEYLTEGRWTPPCCLRILRQTIQHVVNVLKGHNVTFWLEGGSLLGAMRMKDIIPWDYDVDIGMYLNDIGKCTWLKALQTNKEQKVPRVLDDSGYVWEKSHPEEGKFYRVHASARNHLHVDIFPFFSKDGKMTKETWFASHPQDKEFPEHYLKPLTTIEFAGIEVPAPNNIREFLEFKFGVGCVENPQYPHPEMYPFPAELRKFAVINETKNYDT